MLEHYANAKHADVSLILLFNYFIHTNQCLQASNNHKLIIKSTQANQMRTQQLEHNFRREQEEQHLQEFKLEKFKNVKAKIDNTRSDTETTDRPK